jgi:DNA modification methylase
MTSQANSSPSEIFLHKPKKQIEAFPDQSLDEIAKSRKTELKNQYSGNIPKRFLDNWDQVRIYHATGQPEKAFGLCLDPNEGAYDVRNKLNALTGKEWVKFSSSWFIFNALQEDIKAEKSVSLELAEHPATYSPTMIADFIRFFTKEGARVLDPFSGIGSTVEACQRTGRIGIGVELNEKYAALSKLRLRDGVSRVVNANSLELSKLNLGKFDFSISSPPYWDVLNRSTKDFENSRNSRNLDVKYSDSNLDLGNIESYEEFIQTLTRLYVQVLDSLNPGSYMVVIVKNVKKGGKLYPLAWDLARELGPFCELKDEKIWIQDKVALAPYGYPNSWTSNIIHHYCLVFRKA